MDVEVVLLSKNQMIGLPNANAGLGGVIRDCGQSLSVMIQDSWIKGC